MTYLLLSLALPWSCQLYRQHKMDDFQGYQEGEAIVTFPPGGKALLTPGPSPKFVRFTRHVMQNINVMILAKSRLRFHNILDKIRLSHVG